MNTENNTLELDVGRLVITFGVVTQINGEDLLDCIERHEAGDLGEVDDEDRRAVESALETSCFILSAFVDRNGSDFWIITETERSTMTVLLPGEDLCHVTVEYCGEGTSSGFPTPNYKRTRH